MCNPLVDIRLTSFEQAMTRWNLRVALRLQERNSDARIGSLNVTHPVKDLRE